MSARAFSVAAAFAAAAILTPAITASAKDDPAQIKANRDAVRKKFTDAKKIPTADLSYFVDTTKLKDPRWEIQGGEDPKDVDDPKPMMHATFPSGNATDPTPSIELYIWRSPHSKATGGNMRSVFSHEFKSIGKSVKVSDIKDMAAGYYDDWMKDATETSKDKCRASAKKSLGVTEFWAFATGTSKDEAADTAKRMRRDWYLWVQNGSSGAFTWLMRFTTSAKFADNEDWLVKIPDFVKNFDELNDPKLK